MKAENNLIIAYGQRWEDRTKEGSYKRAMRPAYKENVFYTDLNNVKIMYFPISIVMLSYIDAKWYFVEK